MPNDNQQDQKPAQENPTMQAQQPQSNGNNSESAGRSGVRGTAAMDPQTRKEVARKGGLAVSRNRQHMAEIGRKGGQSVSKNREHMARIGRKGGAASRGSHGSELPESQGQDISGNPGLTQGFGGQGGGENQGGQNTGT